MTTQLAAAIESAREAAQLSQRALADRADISQPTLNRILSGKRPAKMTEIIRIAAALGCTVAQLTGPAVSERVLCDSSSPDMDTMRQRLLRFVELDAYLDGQAIPAPR